MKRRSLLQGLLLGTLFPAAALQAAAQPLIQVYLNPGCGCCGGWVEHLRTNGFAVQVHEVDDPGQYRERFKMPEEYASCHSALVEGYALEGHVPAREIQRLLKEKPKAVGLAVPDMPMGSPGMEGGRKDAYDVLLIDASGGHQVYGQYAASVST
jgi:hypothetical protein